MALTDLWISDRNQVTTKRIEQLIAYAGEGKLRDGNNTSEELRNLLAVVPSDLIGAWINECLTNRFQDFGFVLQDIVNEIGHRLGLRITHGVYRGHRNKGYDGVWRVSSGNAILVESKSSTVYSINLATIAAYRKQVAPEIGLAPEDISILLIVGTEDTEELEAQVRGSRYAWSVRLLGIDSLLRLQKLKETLDDPRVERQIQEILVPQEFTRLDRIVDLVFSTAEDVQVGAEEEPEDPTEAGEVAATTTRASFHGAILPRLERHFCRPLVKRSRILWSSPGGETMVSCQVSKEFSRDDWQFWFGLKRTTKEVLESHPKSFCAFGLGSPDLVVLIPFPALAKHLDSFYTSPEPSGDILHWHIRFLRSGDRVELLTNKDPGRFDVSKYVLQG